MNKVFFKGGSSNLFSFYLGFHCSRSTPPHRHIHNSSSRAVWARGQGCPGTEHSMQVPPRELMAGSWSAQDQSVTRRSSSWRLCPSTSHSVHGQATRLLFSPLVYSSAHTWAPRGRSGLYSSVCFNNTDSAPLTTPKGSCTLSRLKCHPVRSCRLFRSHSKLLYKEDNIEGLSEREGKLQCARCPGENCYHFEEN